MLSQKVEAVASSRESLPAADSLGPAPETTTDCSDENSHSGDTALVTNVNSKQPIITLTRLNMPTEYKQQEEQADSNPTSQEAATTGSTDQELRSKEEETTSQASVGQERPAELPADSREEPDSESAAAAEAANEGGEEKEAPAVPGKKSDTGKAKTTPKRRSGRATNRR